MSQSLVVSNLMYLARNMQQCTLECRFWGESAHYTTKECNVMSQHCPFMIPNSKQEKHYINNNF